MSTTKPNQKVTCHGVFVKVFNFGVLLSAPSQFGKSELALELVSRGHSLVADDIVEFRINSDKQIIGYCPKFLQNFIAIRDLGILNLKALYGHNAVTTKFKLDLIVELVETHQQSVLAKHNSDSSKILGVNIDCIKLLANANRNLALIIEVLLRNRELIKCGYNAQQDFINRQTLLCNRLDL